MLESRLSTTYGAVESRHSESARSRAASIGRRAWLGATRGRLALAAFSLALAPVASADAQTAIAPAADVIFEGGSIITNNPAADRAQAVAIRGGVIVAVGTTAEVRGHAGPATRIVDLKGKTVLPGFYDNHIHLGGDEDPRIQDWRKVSSKKELLEALAKRAAERPKGEWILGGLKNENMPQERLPTRWEMDAVTPDHPVALERGHVTLANSLAMKLNGITDATPVPEGGGIDRDAQGRAIGWFREGAGHRMVMKAVPEAPETPDAVAEKELMQELSSKLPLGITSVNVAGMRPHALHWMQNLYERSGENLPRATVQLRLSPGYDSYDDPEKGIAAAISEVEGLGYRTGFGDDRLKIGAIKMSLDGGFSAAAFLTLERYPTHKEDYFGVQRISADTLYRVSKRAYDLGWQLGYHAIGDGAVKIVVDTYARVLQESPRPDARFYMHHVSVMPPEETLALMQKYNIGVASQPNFTYSLGPYNASPALSPARLATNNPQATFIKRGIPISSGSDGMPYGPLVGIYAAVTRKGVDGKVYGPEEKVSVREAVRMYTQGPTWLSFDEKKKGAIEVGKVGDLVVLGEDILTIDPEKIKDIPIEMTVLGGKTLYIRPAGAFAAR